MDACHLSSLSHLGRLLHSEAIHGPPRSPAALPDTRQHVEHSGGPRAKQQGFFLIKRNIVANGFCAAHRKRSFEVERQRLAAEVEAQERDPQEGRLANHGIQAMMTWQV